MVCLITSILSYSQRNIELRRELLKKQLMLIDRYPEEFIERLGISGLERFVNEILDEMNYLKELSKKQSDG